MRNHVSVAKARVIAARTLAIALVTVSMGINSTRAGSDQPPGLNFTPTSWELRTDEPNQLQIITSMRPQSSQKTNSCKFQMVQNRKSPDGVACNRSGDCAHGCCQLRSSTIHVCGYGGPGYDCAPW